MSIYSFICLVGGISASFLGIITIVKNRKYRLNQVFSLFILSVVIWLLATFMMFSNNTDEWIIFWDRVAYIGIVFIPVFLYHFILLFTENEKKQEKILYLGYILSFIFFILSRTDYFIADLYRYNWGVHTQAKFFHSLFLVFFTVYLFLNFLNIYFFQRKISGIQKKQANYIILALLIITISSIGFLPAYGIDIIFPLPYFTAFLCVFILFLAVTKYHLLEVKVINTELFTFTIWGILLIKIFFSVNYQDLLTNGVLTFLIFIMGLLLMRSVSKEVKLNREALEEAHKNLNIEQRLRKTYAEIAEKEIKSKYFR